MQEETSDGRPSIATGHDSMLAIIGGTIIDGNGGAPIKDGMILIEGKRISIVADRSTEIPAGAKRIQAQGKFILPGLMYPKACVLNGSVPDLIRFEGRYDEVFIEAAQLALKSGVTTVFDYAGPRDSLIKARNAINEGHSIGARIYLCGHWIGCGGLFSPDLLDHSGHDVGEQSFDSAIKHEVARVDPQFRARTNTLWQANVGEALISMPAEQVRNEVRQYVESGIDFVSYLVNCHRLPAYPYIAFSPRVQRVIVEEAHRVSLPVQGVFATTEEGVQMALDAGVDMVVPAPYGGVPLSSQMLALIAQRGTFVNIEPQTAAEVEWYRGQPPNAQYPGVLTYVETQEIDHPGMIRAGVPIVSAGWNTLLSTRLRDLLRSATAAQPVAEMGEGHINAMQALQDKGMTAMQALMAMTRNVAKAFNIDRDLGTLERGKLADMVILERNPLESPENFRAIHLVIKEGRVIDRDGLPQRRQWSGRAGAHGRWHHP